MARLIAALAALLLALPSLAQSLPHEKYKLPSGMTVILHEDHSVPVGTINIWYRVGAQNEPPGRSGFAHLYEHLMFMGTRRVEGNQFDVIMENAGGSNNAPPASTAPTTSPSAPPPSSPRSCGSTPTASRTWAPP